MYFKIQIIKSLRVTIYLLFCLSISNSCAQLKPNHKKEPLENLEVQFFSPYGTRLKSVTATEIYGDLKEVTRGYMPWKGNGSMGWDIEIPYMDRYELYLIANIESEGEGTKFHLNTVDKTYSYTLNSTDGPFEGGDDFLIKEAKNFERIKLPGSIKLHSGTQRISVSTSDIEKDKVLFDLRSIEMIPLKKGIYT